MSVLKYSEYDINEVDFENISATAKKKTSQAIWFPLYSGERSPMIQIPKIELTSYGIPTKCEFYKEDYQRNFIKLPLDTTKPEIQSFISWLQKLDEKLNKKEIKEKVFGKKNPKCSYQSVLRTPMTEDGKPKSDKLPYIKVKFMTKYPTGEITTPVIIQCSDGEKRLAHDTHSMDDVLDLIKFKSKVKCILVPSKLWIIPPSGGDAMYGLSFKLAKVLVEQPPEKIVTPESIIEGFIESDKED